jgi:hypothetical protein
MDLKTYILPGYKLTLAEGHYQDVEEVEEDIDEFQTYDMTPEEFNSHTISSNEQSVTKAPFIREVKVKNKNLIKIEFEEDDLYNFNENFIINSDCAIMGGLDHGWLVGDLQGIIDKLPEGVDAESITSKYTQMEAGQYVQVDEGKDLRKKEIKSVEKLTDVDEEQTVYWIDMLEKGDSVFVNDIMVGVRRANDNPNTPEVLEED